jgi:uncharacterized protein YciU (UPF0263 family)
MANLIDTTYFVGEISLPGSALSGDYADILPYIAKYEREALIELLGYTLYKELKAEIDADPQVFTTKWSRLVNGHEYEIEYLGDTHLVKWNGLVNDDKISLLAYYIYFKYVQFHVTHTSGFGELIQAAENAAKVSPGQKMVNAWNRFIDLRGRPSEPEINPSAYNFLFEFEDDETNGFDLWLFTVHRFTNNFGI